MRRLISVKSPAAFAANFQIDLGRGREMRARDVMTTDVVSVMPGHSIRHATQIMLDHDVSGLPVVDGDGLLVGVLTEGDLMRRSEIGTDELRVSPDNDPSPAKERRYVQGHAWCVQDVMTSPVTSIGEEETLAATAAIFLAKKIKRVPVVRDRRVVGIVSRRDLLRAVTDAPPAEYIVGDNRILIGVLARLREVDDLIGDLPEVTVHHGVIHLSGDVRSQAVRDTIRVIAEGVRGSSGVEDNMTIVPVTGPITD